MKQRGRKSADSMGLRVNGSRARLQPPAYLTKEQRELFNNIVESCRPDHFVPSDQVLLSAYIQSAFINQDAGRRMVTEPKMIRVFESSAKTMAMLSMRLRLAPQSRTQPKTAARNVGMGRPRTNFLMNEDEDEEVEAN